MRALFFVSIMLALSSSLIMAQSHAYVKTGEGLQLIASGPLQLVFNNSDFVNNGKFTSLQGSTSTFIASQAQENISIGGRGPTIFNNLIANTNFYELQLHNNISVSGNLLIQSGNLQLNNQILDLGKTGYIIGER